ncbi:4760_t:CDS:2, partial [Gigaspora rosea]
KKRVEQKTVPNNNGHIQTVPNDNDHMLEIIPLNNLSEYIAELTAKNDIGLCFTVQVDIADINMSDQNFNIKSIAHMIVDHIEEADGYSWTPRISTRHENVGTFYFCCSQSNKLALNFKHNILHDKPVDVTTPIEIRQEIKANLHLDPIQLWTYLQDKFDISKSEEDHVNSTYAFLKSKQAAGCELCFELITNQ